MMTTLGSPSSPLSVRIRNQLCMWSEALPDIRTVSEFVPGYEASGWSALPTLCATNLMVSDPLIYAKLTMAPP
jgi:hypothetical protein